MTLKQEMLLTLFSKEALEIATKQFKNSEIKIPLDSFDMSFRLFKPTDFNINLEVLIQINGNNQNVVPFLKPIGFYTLKRSFFTDEIEVTILKEFEEDFDFLLKIGKIPSGITIKKLSLVENALIAAYSMDAVVKAINHKDYSSVINGLEIDILMTYDNEYPQMFLNDKYGVKGHIAAYFFRGSNKGIAPSINYENISPKLQQMGLYSAFKNIMPESFW